MTTLPNMHICKMLLRVIVRNKMTELPLKDLSHTVEGPTFLILSAGLV